MTKAARVVEVSLKIPDNTAYTALVALRRLGVDAGWVERGELVFFDDEISTDALTERVKADETIFNPNIHRLMVRETGLPGAGEVWIESLDGTVPTTAWRLFDERGKPLSEGALQTAVERLLCNPSIDRAIVGGITR